MTKIQNGVKPDIFKYALGAVAWLPVLTDRVLPDIDRVR